MIPKNYDSVAGDFQLLEQPSATFFLNRKENFMSGRTDGLEAVRQAVYLILQIERFDYPIYSWNYGIECKDLFGKPTGYVCSILPGRIREALMQDKRITGVDTFTFTRKKGTVSAAFVVHTRYGDFEQEKEVKIS